MPTRRAASGLLHAAPSESGGPAKPSKAWRRPRGCGGPSLHLRAAASHRSSHASRGRLLHRPRGL
eukprot:7977221-Alexandrium_andersonii.AAC.1